jgi:hypothetical protein
MAAMVWEEEWLSLELVKKEGLKTEGRSRRSNLQGKKYKSRNYKLGFTNHGVFMVPRQKYSGSPVDHSPPSTTQARKPKI